MTDRKKSDFPAKVTIPGDATFDFVSHGTNYKIALSDLLAALGATGTIVQDGDPLGVPVVDMQGTVNTIRNVEASVGITAAVSAQNGLALKTSLLPGGTGTEILKDPTTAPKIKSLVAGAGITLVDNGDYITISSP